MIQVVKMSLIKTDRELQPTDDIGPLVADIRERGLQVPIAISPKFELIDGLRRIKALEKLGEIDVSTLLCTTFEEAVAELDQTRVEGTHWRPPSPRRVWELQNSLRPLVEKRLKDQRALAKGKPQHSRIPALEPSRSVVSKAIGQNSDSYLAESQNLWNIATNETHPEQEMALDLLKRVEAGEMPLYGVRPRLDHAAIFGGDVLTLREQERLIKNFIHNLSAVLTAGSRMGPIHPKMSKEDRKNYLKELTLLRRQLYTFVKTFEQETEK